MAEGLLGNVMDRPVLDSSNPHIALALVLDVSYSMQGVKMDSLNTAVNNLIKQVQSDDRIRDTVDLGIFVFGEKGRNPVYSGFQAMSEYGKVRIEATDGSTYVAESLRITVDTIRNRVDLYAQGGGAYKPWIILITDGGFHDGADLNEIAARLRQRQEDNKLQFFGLGVEGYNRKQLESLTNNPRQIIEVKAINFNDFLSWVGRSMATISTNAIDSEVVLEPLVFTV